MIPFPNIHPEIFTVSIFGIDFSLRWYALSYVVGFLFALSVMKFFLRRKSLWLNLRAPMASEKVDNFLTYLILGVIIGGRLGYVIFYNAGYYLENPANIVRVWDGGMSFHGGFLGVILAVFFYCRYNGISLSSSADLVALASPPGLLLGRLANFINSELWGRPTLMPWGVIFPGDLAQNCPNVIGLCARHPSQIYEAVLEGAFLFAILIFFAFWGALRRPGLIAGCFFMIYGASRFFVEFFRVPDPQFFSETNPYGHAFRLGEYGFTMGQLLSAPMIVVGILVIYGAFAFFTNSEGKN